ncbi:molybdopterin-dependent oxidoreductase [Deinococcus humi]|uniref:Oxidoreductase molybdopterin-binding domain-containing protein n=1 Tax=Deinococcus humi TaxID=662880 RepID=A0A7W8NDB5_9DEIO|nr:hypothetical protein [Deinococcus humi]GGO20166.1 hypothetical protein GCM10008949_05150 [Deinococcus humi]
MAPLNPASWHRRVRLSVLLSLIALIPLSSGSATQNAVTSTTKGPVNRAGGRVPPLPPSPFTYLHGARPLPAARPDERVIFQLDGPGAPQTFTLRQLQALPTVRYTTLQPQLKQEAVYEGVPLRDLAALGGFAGRDVRVYASNGFVATILAHDYLNEPVMLAYRVGGQPIPVLQKGPLTVVLPRRPARFFTPAYSAAWVWFAVRLGPVP